jgi:hypothetical protein
MPGQLAQCRNHRGVGQEFGAPGAGCLTGHDGRPPEQVDRSPLPRKLGIKEASTVVLVSAPEGFESALRPLPDRATLRRGNRRRREITIWFVTSRHDLMRGFDALARAVGEGMLWVSWPKQSSEMAGDVTEDVVRDLALERGMVDTKVCVIDETWSGLRLTRRRRSKKSS